MADPGRNDPCVCGSGRKFKHCCLQSRASDASARVRLRGVEGRVVDALLQFTAATWGESLIMHAWEDFWNYDDVPDDLASTPEFDAMFIPWPGRLVAEVNSERRGDRLKREVTRRLGQTALLGRHRCDRSVRGARRRPPSAPNGHAARGTGTGASGDSGRDEPATLGSVAQYARAGAWEQDSASSRSNPRWPRATGGTARAATAGTPSRATALWWCRGERGSHSDGRAAAVRLLHVGRPSAVGARRHGVCHVSRSPHPRSAINSTVLRSPASSIRCTGMRCLYRAAVSQ